MKISLEPEFSGGQDIHQNSCNFKYFSAFMVPVLLRRVIFVSILISKIDFEYSGVQGKNNAYQNINKVQKSRHL